jgi:hypothetical protein
MRGFRENKKSAVLSPAMSAQQGHAPVKPFGGDPKYAICFNCREQGHKVADCTEPPGGRASRSSSSASSGNAKEGKVAASYTAIASGIRSQNLAPLSNEQLIGTLIESNAQLTASVATMASAMAKMAERISRLESSQQRGPPIAIDGSERRSQCCGCRHRDIDEKSEEEEQREEAASEPLDSIDRADCEPDQPESKDEDVESTAAEPEQPESDSEEEQIEEEPAIEEQSEETNSCSSLEDAEMIVRAETAGDELEREVIHQVQALISKTYTGIEVTGFVFVNKAIESSSEAENTTDTTVTSAAVESKAASSEAKAAEESQTTEEPDEEPKKPKAARNLNAGEWQTPKSKGMLKQAAAAARAARGKLPHTDHTSNYWTKLPIE